MEVHKASQRAVDLARRILAFSRAEEPQTEVQYLQPLVEEALKLTKFSVDHASVSTFLVDADARLLYVNEQACRSLGYTREELLAMTVADLDPGFPRTAWSDHWTKVK